MRARPGGSGSPCSKGRVSAHAAAGIGDLAEQAGRAGPLSVIAIDIPIGLPDTGRRRADLLVRKAVGPRWASVFMTPVRPALEAADYAEATATSLRLAGEGISRQAFALQAKILQVDRWVRQTRHRVVEVHPEASFAQLAGGTLHSSKSTWTGVALRRQLLADVGIVLPEDLGPAGEKAAVDDVPGRGRGGLDRCACHPGPGAALRQSARAVQRRTGLRHLGVKPIAQPDVE
jgi:predicted RNase H-like nuclease